MRISKLQQVLALVLVMLTVEGGCIILPEVKSKMVDLVASGTVCDTLDAIGIINDHNERSSFDIKEGVNLQELADDAGVDLNDIDTVYVSGVFYKVTQPDPEPAREISNGNVKVLRGSLVGGNFVAADSAIVISNFSVLVNSVTTDTTAPVEPAGIQLIEQLLNECLKEAKGGPTVSNTAIQYHVTGQSLPQNVATDFKWRICVSLNMPAPTEVDVIE